MFVAFEKQLISRGYIPFVKTNNIGNNKDTIAITNISNFPIPISENVKAKILIIF